MMKTLQADIVVYGGSLGGVLAGYSSAKAGKKTLLFSETEWIGGQLTSQAVPPDEHKWIEETGCTQTYREYRNKVRNYYRTHPFIIDELKTKDFFCPGGSSVSRLSHPPRLALKFLEEMLAPFIQSGVLTVFYGYRLASAEAGDEIKKITLKKGNETLEAVGKYFLDASDEGDLIKESGCEYVTGAESKAMTGEPSALDTYMPEDRQPVTWSVAFENRLKGDYVIDKPADYERFKKLITPYDNKPVFSMYGPDSSTGKAKLFGMYNGEFDENGNKLFGLYTYRRIVNSYHFKDGAEPYDVTMLNWPQNDYFLGNTFDCEHVEENREEAKQFSLAFLYWLQTEAPNGDKKGYPFFRACPEAVGTSDGATQTYYVRESRRIKALYTIKEQDITPGGNPDFYDSVGVGSYSIDLHITTKTHSFFYKPSLRFTIPLRAMIPVRMTNLLPACKNIGATHLTGGCYRLHPIEWNVGEVAGLLASYSLDEGVSAREIAENKDELVRFQNYLQENGIQLHW